MSAKKNLWLATASALVLFTAAPAMAQTDTKDANVTVVSPDGPAEQAGEKIDNAAAATADAASDAADATATAADNAADATADAANDAATAAGNAATQAADATGDAMDAATETDAAEVAEGTPVEGQIFEQSPNTYLASTLMDATILNASDEEVGDVNDMIITADGTVEGVVIGVGGFLGIGQKDVAVELSRVKMSTDENGDFVFNADLTKEELEAAPEFMTAEDAEMEAQAPATATPATTTN